VPVVFSPEISRDFAHSLASALAASSVFRGTTFLADRLDSSLGSETLTLVDDATLKRRPGSRAFDGEGVRCRRTVLVDRGRVASWLSDCYSARRASFHTTGSAMRSVAGEVGVGTSNLVLEPGLRAPADLIGDVRSGLYVTDLFGFGVNLAAGTWSRGGSGIWIDGGQLAYPVQEFTIAGDLRAMLAGVREVANDLEWHGATAAPTLSLDGLTVASGA
jgi:PmbA protein